MFDRSKIAVVERPHGRTQRQRGVDDDRILERRAPFADAMAWLERRSDGLQRHVQHLKRLEHGGGRGLHRIGADIKLYALSSLEDDASWDD